MWSRTEDEVVQEEAEATEVVESLYGRRVMLLALRSATRSAASTWEVRPQNFCRALVLCAASRG